MPDDPMWFRLELVTRRHEKKTLHVVEQRLRPGMTMLDIGAHVGYYAVAAARLVGERGRVLAFEPNPRIFTMLQRNVANYPAVQPLQMAVSDSTGTAELFDYLVLSGSASLHYDAELLEREQANIQKDAIAPRLGQQFAAQKYSVETARLDDVLADKGIETVDFIKMDIEGAEIHALRGMSETIARSPRLQMIMEFNPQALKAFEHAAAAALREVLALGFARVEVIQEDGSLAPLSTNDNSIEQLAEQLLHNGGNVNLLFSKIS
jgi:FkbM family methyltransferase